MRALGRSLLLFGFIASGSAGSVFAASAVSSSTQGPPGEQETPGESTITDVPAVDDPEVDRSKVEEKLALAKELPTDDALRLKLINAYDEALNALTEAQEHETEQAKFDARAQASETRIAEIGAEIDRIRELQAPVPDAFSGADVDALDARVAELTRDEQRLASSLTALEQALDDESSGRSDLAADRSRVEERIVYLQKEIESLDTVETSTQEEAANLLRARAQRQSKIAERERLRVEDTTSDARLELRRAEVELERARASRAKAQRQAAATKLNQVRSEIAEAARLAAKEERDKLASSLFRDVANATLALREGTIKVTQKVQLLDAQTQGIDAERETLEQRFIATKDRVEIPSLTEAAGLRLRQERRRLSAARARLLTVDNAKAGHAKAEVSQFRLEARATALANRPDSVEDLAKKAVAAQASPDYAGPTLTLEEARATAQRLTDEYSVALGDASAAVRIEIAAWRDLKEQRDELLGLIETAEGYIAERVLWIRSSEPAWRVHPEDVGHEFAEALDRAEWAEIWSAAKEHAMKRPWRLVLVLLGLVLLIVGRLRLGKVLTDEAELARQRTQLSIAPTLRALGLSLLMAAPYGAALAAGSWFAQSLVEDHADVTTRALAISDGCMSAALMAWILSALYVFTGKNGLSAAHFDWSEGATKLVRRTMRWMLVVVPIATLVSGFLAGLETGSDDSVTSVFVRGNDGVSFAEALPRLVFLVAVIGVLIGHMRVLHPSRGILAINAKSAVPNDVLTKLRRLWYSLGIVLMFAVVVGTIFGYGFTARSLFGRLVATFGFIVTVFVFRAIGLRWTKLVRRREAFDRLRRRRDEAREKRLAEIERRRNAGEDTEELESQGLEVEQEQVDVAALSSNVLGLVRALTGLVAIAGVFWIWASVLPALGIFDQVRLWSHEVLLSPDGSDALGSSIGTEWVTLVDLGRALLTLALTWLAVRDLPSLLEIVLLERLELGSGERYAITTLLRYLLTIIGLFMAFDALGLSWSKLQWLVAGVSVGLGFGLQEIFANFVSGITLLFERPVRVGDWVTLGDIEGVVSKIRIRATTIRDRDLKELIVPNREFITGRFINWTLSDPVSRVTLGVGIAYGSDTERAIALLLDAGKSCPFAVPEPSPSVVFSSFGSSSLDFELRVFVSGREIMPSVIHDLHMRVDAAFRAADIEISFPQQDVHIRTAEGLPQPPVAEVE